MTLQGDQPLPWRVLIVEDQPEWFEGMAELLEFEAKQLELPVHIETATNESMARHCWTQRYFHLISLDMRLPSAQGTLTEETGVMLARSAYRDEALASKLIVYSAHMGASSDGSLYINAHLPKLDRYAKGEHDDAQHGRGLESLTQRGWASRVIRYLVDEQRVLPEGQSPLPDRLSAVGCWLAQAQKHLPPLLARHATLLADAWDSPSDQSKRTETAIRFIEATLRLALAQTMVLLRLKPDVSLPANETWIEAHRRLVEAFSDPNNSTELKKWTWSWHLKRALPWLGKARDLRNATYHSLVPDAGTGNWPALRLPLQAAMDLASYWAQNPLWRRATRTPSGDWLVERLAGNQWPRERRKLAQASTTLPDRAMRGQGVWQMALRRRDGDPGADATPSSTAFCWDEWIESDVHARELWLPLHQNARARTPEWTWLDLDQGAYRSRSTRASGQRGKQ